MQKETRKKLNFFFFVLNLVIAFVTAYNGSYLCILNLFVSFICWSAYKYQDNLEKELEKR